MNILLQAIQPAGNDLAKTRSHTYYTQMELYSAYKWLCFQDLNERMTFQNMRAFICFQIYGLLENVKKTDCMIPRYCIPVGFQHLSLNKE
jgi:hypothetical protein